MIKSIPYNEIAADEDKPFRAAVFEGIEAADDGRLSPFEPVAEWLSSLGN